MTVYLLATLDTKGREAAFVRDRLRELGVEVALVDTGCIGQPTAVAEVLREDVFAAAGTTLEVLRARGDRGLAVQAAALGARKIVLAAQAAGKLAGVLALGGSAGTTIGTEAMRALPLGVPKLMVSTLASGQTRHFVGDKDILMLNSVVDILGLNRVSRAVLGEAASAMAGMVKFRAGASSRGSATPGSGGTVTTGLGGSVAPGSGGGISSGLGSVLARSSGETGTTDSGSGATRSSAGSVPTDPDADRPLVAVTMFGVTTPCVERAKEVLEAAGYEVLVFHATGNGGQALESLVREGMFAGVLDITTTELADELVGGVLSAGPTRLTAAAETGTPQVVSAGALDMVNFHGIDSVPEKFRGRKLHRHNANVTLMRTSAAENAALGTELAQKLARSRGPVSILLPMLGVSAIDREGETFDDPLARRILFDSIRAHCHGVECLEYSLHINDPAFAELAANRLLAMMKFAPRR